MPKPPPPPRPRRDDQPRDSRRPSGPGGGSKRPAGPGDGPRYSAGPGGGPRRAAGPGGPKRPGGPAGGAKRAAGPDGLPRKPRRTGRAAATKQPHKPGEERLQKVMAHAGIASRRACEEMITQGRVSVDGKVVRELGTLVNPARQAVAIDGQRIKEERHVYYAVNKPKGYVSTNDDPSGRPRVLDILPEIPQRVYTVGRLDEMSVGLMILTNDGELANKLAHPKFGVEKVYRVVVAGTPTHEILDKVIEGVWLAEGKVRARRIKVVGKKGDSTVLDMVLAEGKNREVRRMLAKFGHKVMALTRVAIGPITLRGLNPGAFRPLHAQEVDLLRKVAAGVPVPGIRFAEGRTARTQARSGGPGSPPPRAVGRPEGPGPRSRRDSTTPPRPADSGPPPHARAQDQGGGARRPSGPPQRPEGPAHRPGGPPPRYQAGPGGPPPRYQAGGGPSGGARRPSGPPPRPEGPAHRPGGPPPRYQAGPGQSGGVRRPSGPPQRSDGPTRRPGGPPPRPQEGAGRPGPAGGPRARPQGGPGGSRRPPSTEPPARRIIGMEPAPQYGPLRLPTGPPPSQRQRSPEGRRPGPPPRRPDGPPPRVARPPEDGAGSEAQSSGPASRRPAPRRRPGERPKPLKRPKPNRGDDAQG